ncbi:MAG: MBL fold metallo-hydrolase [Paludibacter sp.]|nr:MBL fold metallo-hydrolase [Paludibacter sp.]
MNIIRIENPIFTSNTYIISSEKHNWVWLVDIGGVDGVINSLSKDSMVRGVFITHSHFDHIYGINKLIDTFPECIVFTSVEGKKGLYSEKLNLSFYHDEPIVFEGSNVQILHENDKIELFENCFLETIQTPGHDWSCLTFKVDNCLFTGDSFIPNVKVVTKLKGGNKEENIKSLAKIMSNICENSIICPGHGEMSKIDALNPLSCY